MSYTNLHLLEVTSDSPIFIVGATKSGTALTQAILNGHPDVWTSGETHYFDHLRLTMRGCEQRALSAKDAQRCEDYFLALSHRPYGHCGSPGRGRLLREELRGVAEEVGQGADAYYEGYCRLNAFKVGKARWGDKTPRHVFRIAEILERFPKAQVICMVRDPRAVIASNRERATIRENRVVSGYDSERDPEHLRAFERDLLRANKSYNILIHCLLWRGVVRAALRAQERFGEQRVYLLRYEDIVTSPEKTITKLAGWLSMDFLATMLDVPMLNSSFSRFSRHEGISQAPVHRWRRILSQTEVGIIQACCSTLMRKSTYELQPVKTPVIPLLLQWLVLPVRAIRAVVANRHRIGHIPGYVWRRVSLAIRP